MTNTHHNEPIFIVHEVNINDFFSLLLDGYCNKDPYEYNCYNNTNNTNNTVLFSDANSDKPKTFGFSIIKSVSLRIGPEPIYISHGDNKYHPTLYYYSNNPEHIFRTDSDNIPYYLCEFEHHDVKYYYAYYNYYLMKDAKILINKQIKNYVNSIDKIMYYKNKYNYCILSCKYLEKN